MHTKNMSVTPNKKACLLVSRRRPCQIYRRDPLLKEQGKVENAQIRQREQILSNDNSSFEYSMRIIHDSHFKRIISLEEQEAQKQGRFFCGTQIAYLIYENFRVTRANDSVENYADVVTIGLRNDSIQEFDSKWDGILLSLTKILPATILEGLYKLRIRESQKFKTVLELYDLEIYQKK